jgi:hypothetical protein
MALLFFYEFKVGFVDTLYAISYILSVVASFSLRLDGAD